MPVGAALMGGASLITGLLSALGVGQQQGGYEQVNPYTDQFYQQLMQSLAQSQNAQQAGLDRSTAAQSKQTGIANDMGQTVDQMGNLQQPEAMDWFNNWLGAVPEYQRIAQQAGEQFTETAGRSIQEQGRLNQAQAMTDAAAQFAGQNAFSGAAASAVGQAAAKPLADAQAQLTGQQANIASQTFNQQAGQGQGLAFQGTQNEFNNALQALTQALQGQQLQAGVFGQQAGMGLTEANMAMQQGNNILAQQGQIAQPVYQQQQGSDPLAIISQLLQGAGGVSDMFGPGQGMPSNYGNHNYGGNNYTPQMDLLKYDGFGNVRGL